MLNYNQTIEKMDGIRAELKAIEGVTDWYKHRELLKKYYEAGNKEVIKTAEAEYTEKANREQELKRFLTVYKSNAEKLYILENIQMVIDIFNKYSGKKCGEKTKEKIKAEAKENGCAMYFSDDTIIFYMGLYGYDRIEVHTRYIEGEKQTITDNENKIRELSDDMFHLPDADAIIDNVEEYTKQKEAEFLNLVELYKALEEATSKYNKNCPFKYQTIRDGIYRME